jgi:hypothetical protein
MNSIEMTARGLCAEAWRRTEQFRERRQSEVDYIEYRWNLYKDDAKVILDNYFGSPEGYYLCSKEFTDFCKSLLSNKSAAVWIPIELAPKDGTLCVIYNPECGTTYRFKTAWYDQELDSWHDGQTCLCEPTHFMILPNPPTQGENI